MTFEFRLLGIQIRFFHVWNLSQFIHKTSSCACFYGFHNYMLCSCVDEAGVQIYVRLLGIYHIFVKFSVTGTNLKLCVQFVDKL